MTASLAGGARAFFTLSMLIDSRQIDALIADGVAAQFGHRPARPIAWDQALLEALRDDYADSQVLHRAIDPMFNDIADRARNLFIEDFLLDTPSLGSGGRRDPMHVNVCAEVTLRLPRQLKWHTEGREVRLDLVEEVRFEGVLCRAFWLAHSNNALSYHLSFEVPYARTLAQFFGLSMLQKAFFPSEGVDWLLDPAEGLRIEGSGGRGGAAGFLAFIEDLFGRHVGHLFDGVADMLAHRPGEQAARFPAGDAVAAAAWQSLVLEAGDWNAGRDPELERVFWKDASRRRRLLVILRDAKAFELLAAENPHQASLMALTSIEPELTSAGPDAAVERHEERRVLERIAAQLGPAAGPSPRPSLPCDDVLYCFFLSGFFQNIVDFLEQDGREVHDGLAPIYPAVGATASNEGFILYATPSAMYEVVEESRSLDEAGRKWLGTCPYVFLVHMTAFHNESLVRQYELNVSRLLDRLRQRGLVSGAVMERSFGTALDFAFAEIKRFRLETFEQVHKHYAFNCFRYETERSFFGEVEAVRGMVQRRAYWDEVLGHLTETIDGLREDERDKSDQRLNRVAFGIGCLSAFQLLFQLWDLNMRSDARLADAAWGRALMGSLAAVAIGFVFWLVLGAVRDWRRRR